MRGWARFLRLFSIETLRARHCIQIGIDAFRCRQQPPPPVAPDADGPYASGLGP